MLVFGFLYPLFALVRYIIRNQRTIRCKHLLFVFYGRCLTKAYKLDSRNPKLKTLQLPHLLFLNIFSALYFINSETI